MIVSFNTIWTLTPFVLLIFARCLGVFIFAPFFLGNATPRSARLLLAALLTLLVFPFLQTSHDIDWNKYLSLSGAIQYALSWGGEFAYGVAIGLVLRLFFDGIYLAGEMIARVGGISVANVFDQNSGEEISAISRLLFWIALTVFIALHGMEFFVDGVLNSFVTNPIEGSWEGTQLVEKIFMALSEGYSLGFRIAAPVIGTSLIMYLVSGFVNRIFTQLNLVALSFNCNSLLTLTILFLGIGVFCHCFQNDLTVFLERIFAIEG